MSEVKIGSHLVGALRPTYFIADIAANHDGSLKRALMLMDLAKDAGAHAAKFQHFRAEWIVSDYGFRQLGTATGHQASWSKSVFDVYKDASLPWEWTEALANHASDIGIDFLSTPYDLDAVVHLAPYVSAFKIGSGDVNWLEQIELIVKQNKPVLLAVGAADLEDVDRAMKVLKMNREKVVLMQCNTNYLGSVENIQYANLNVLRTFQERFPDAILGLSDHTPGHITVMGAVALGARVIEKHFTEDPKRSGPDHAFSMCPSTWKEMVQETLLLQGALGDGVKRVETNERETLILQRRCVRAARDIRENELIGRDDIQVLRPAPPDAIPAHEVSRVVGARSRRNVNTGEYFSWDMIHH